MRIVFCGSGPFAVPTLKALAEHHDLAAVITQPARPAGRGGKLRPTAVAQACAEMSRPAHPIRDINQDDALAVVRSAGPDAIVVADFGQFLRQAVRGLARVDSINLHGSILPELRGAAPINWAIIRGQSRTGVTTFSLVDKMDAGKIYVSRETVIEPGETAEQLRSRLAQIGAQAVLETLDLLERQGPAAGREQDESKVTLAPPLKKSDGLLDWSAPAEAICNRIRGTWPWPGGQTSYVHHNRCTGLILARAEVAPGQGRDDLRIGQLDDELCVKAGQGRVRILELQPAGKKLIAWRDFVNGYRCQSGDLMLTQGREMPE